MSPLRCSSGSLYTSQSTTCTMVRSAIMGMASTASVRAWAVRPLPSSLWKLKASNPSGTSWRRISDRQNSRR